MDAKQRYFEKNKDVYGLWARGWTQAEIARELKLSQQAISKRLKTLKKRFPTLFGNPPVPKVLRYIPEYHDHQAKEQF